MRGYKEKDDKDKGSDSDSKQKTGRKERKDSRTEARGFVSKKKSTYFTFYCQFFLSLNRFGWSKRKVPLSRSGRVIKGRGVFVCIINSIIVLITFGVSF